jgi:hypothetical protein
MKQTATVTVEVVDARALRLLRDMEQLRLIRLDPLTETQGKQKLSQRFAGALHLNDERYKAFQTSIRKGRDEWNRPIC